jgi:superfamily I DNA/RNA helicase
VLLLPLQLLLEASDLLPELEDAVRKISEAPRRTAKDLDELRKLRKRIGNLNTLIKLAGNTAAYTESPVLGLPEIDPETGFESSDGMESDQLFIANVRIRSNGELLGYTIEPSNHSGSSDSDSQLPLLQPTTGLPLLQQLYDHCVLQGEDDGEEDDAETVQLMTMHASKGKEFACVSVLRVHEGAIPSIRKDEPSRSAAELEQERNLLYVAITRAKE